MIVDCHMHVNLDGYDAKKVVAHLDSIGVDNAWLLTWELLNGLTSGYTHLSEGEMWDACKKYPKRFIPFYAPDPGRPDAERALNVAIRKGLKGFGECKVMLCLDHPDLVRLFRIAADHGLPILLHLDKPLPSSPGFWYNYSMDTLGRLLQTLPHAKFVGHGPGFWRYVSGDEERDSAAYPKGKIKPGGKLLQFLDRYKNLFCDLSANSGLNAICRDPQWGRRFLVKYSARILYGTDSYDKRLMDHLNGLKLDSRVMGRIMGENALRLLSR